MPNVTVGKRTTNVLVRIGLPSSEPANSESIAPSLPRLFLKVIGASFVTIFSLRKNEKSNDLLFLIDVNSSFTDCFEEIGVIGFVLIRVSDREIGDAPSNLSLPSR